MTEGKMMVYIMADSVYNYSLLTTEQLLSLLDEWKGAGAYSITGEIIRELRLRRQNQKNENRQ